MLGVYYAKVLDKKLNSNVDKKIYPWDHPALADEVRGFLFDST
jgi:hypothetical protein